MFVTKKVFLIVLVGWGFRTMDELEK